MEIPEGFTNCRFIFTLTGVLDPMGFSLGVQGEPGDSASDVALKAYNQWQEVFISTPASMLSGWTFLGVSATKTVAGEPTVGEYISPISGTGAAQGLVVNTCMLVRKNTAAGGRKNRGRMFIPPFNLSELDVSAGGVIAPAFIAGQQTGWDEFLTQLGVATIPPWLFHSDPADAPTPINSFTPQSLAATQRRRMR